MPLLSLNLAAIQKARLALATQRGEQRDASARHQQARAEIERLRRAGADPHALDDAAQQVQRLAEAARSADRQAKGSLASIRELSEQLRAGRDPALMVQALAATHPVLLMPVAVQTRYDD